MRSWKCVTFLVPLFFVFCLASTASSAQMEDRLQELERKVDKLKAPQETSSKMADFIDRLNMSVKIGIWETYKSPYDDNGGETSDIALDTLEVYFKPRLNDWIQGYVELEYDDDDASMKGEEGRIMVKNPTVIPVYAEFGKFEAIPFGGFETFMIEDSLTEKLGEIKDVGAVVGFERAGLNLRGCLYNGDVNEAGEKDDHLDDYSLKGTYSTERGPVSLQVGASYLNNVANSDVSDYLDTTPVQDKVAGADGFAIIGWRDLTVIGEYIAALDDFQGMQYEGENAEPSIWNVELGYGFSVMERPCTVAVGYAASKEFANENMSESDAFIPETRYMAHFDTEIMDNVSWGVEYQQNEAYDESWIDPAVRGQEENVVRTELAMEF
ncbi:MAG: LbtU family siderophore porin [Desulfohalobiaceae bacterium]|nr:LbtU family siderophore porin [Desulfohalobiaceae bacterium]